MEEKMNKHEFNLSGHLWGINRSHKIYLKHFADEVGITLGQYPYLVALSYNENYNHIRRLWFSVFRFTNNLSPCFLYRACHAGWKQP